MTTIQVKRPLDQLLADRAAMHDTKRKTTSFNAFVISDKYWWNTMNSAGAMSLQRVARGDAWA